METACYNECATVTTIMKDAAESRGMLRDVGNRECPDLTASTEARDTLGAARDGCTLERVEGFAIAVTVILAPGEVRCRPYASVRRLRHPVSDAVSKCVLTCRSMCNEGSQLSAGGVQMKDKDSWQAYNSNEQKERVTDPTQ